MANMIQIYIISFTVYSPTGLSFI